MRDYLQQARGWKRHQHFGLRTEWIRLYIDRPCDWERTGALGNRQVESLKAWLRTTGLQDEHGQETAVARFFGRRGLHDTLAWEVLWVNVVFAFPTAAWYVSRMGLGCWTTAELQTLLQNDVPRLAPITARDAIAELVGLLERTPVGKEIGQGIVLPMRPRVIRREGRQCPSAEAVLYATSMLFVRQQREQLAFNDEVLWPWTVFGCRQEYVLQKLILDGGRYFTVTDQSISIKPEVKEWLGCGYMPITWM